MTQDELSATLSRILKDIAYIGQKAPLSEAEDCPPCADLITAGLENGMYEVAAAILKNRLQEFSINGGLLKLHWSWRIVGSLKMDVSDNSGRYPVTVARIKDLLHKEGLLQVLWM